MAYTTIITEGGLLPAEILDSVAEGTAQGQRAEDFGLEKGARLSDEIAAAWGDARSYWDTFQRRLNRLRASDSPTTLTREQWVAPLLETLGYRLSYQPSAAVVEGRTYAISHREGGTDGVPVHIEGIDKKLDERPPSGRPRLSPHGLIQEYLNSTEQVWGVVTNGERLRLLRDSSRFTRPAYLEFDLRTMLEGEKFSEFALLYRLLHRSRLPQADADAASCLLEKYHQQAIEAGGRVREGLRDGVEAALKRLGSGLLQHPANAELRRKLAANELSALDYYRQLLRLVYRLLFLMVAEERNLIAAEVDESDPLSPLAFRPSADARLAIYRDYYSVGRLRRMAEQSGVGRGPYDDLWQSLLTTFELLEGSDEQRPRALGLAPLDGDLFGYAACADLTSDTQLRNGDLLATVRALALYREKESKSLRRVNYAALDVEELGSVYESLLDYRPVVTITNNQSEPHNAPLTSSQAADKDLGYFALVIGHFDLVTGTERKTTGSYYTRPELVQELIKSALDPVVEERLKAAGSDPKAQEWALLGLTVCDPACGSGHFLLAAARRIGRALAKVRSGEDQPTPTQFRKAVRDVIGRCIFGVDLNPLAVDLCKLALWIEGHNAGMPLSFLDHHIKQGNSLIGAMRKLVEAGIPDDAYKPVTGDDKKLAGEIRKRNKKEREQAALGMAQQSLFDDPAADAAPALAEALRRLDDQTDDSVAAVRARAAAYRKLREDYSAERTLFDLWTAAFFQPLTPENARHVPTTKDLLDHQRSPKDLRDPKVALAYTLAQEVGFFHWELEFPQVFGPQIHRSPDSHSPAQREREPGGEGAGFDVVLGNPPWEQIELREEEFFVDIPEIRNAANKLERQRRIDAWRKGDDKQREHVALFETAKYQAEAERRFIKEAGKYPLCAVGRLNTYALFVEASYSITASIGRTGIIVPTGIATDETYKEFFEYISTGNMLISLFDFENRENIFPGVGHGRYKFCLLTLGKSNYFGQYCFFATRVKHLQDPLRIFLLSTSEISLINPNTFTCPVFRTKLDAQLVKNIYQRHPIIINERNGSNPWGVVMPPICQTTGSSSATAAEGGYAAARSAPTSFAALPSCSLRKRISGGCGSPPTFTLRYSRGLR